MNTFFETAHTDPMHEMKVAFSEYALECADQDRRLNMINDTYNVNIACAEHKVLTESGSYDDLAMLFEAAEEEKKKETSGIIASIGKAWEALLSKFRAWHAAGVGGAVVKAAKEEGGTDVNPDGKSVPDPNFISKIWGDIRAVVTKFKGWIVKKMFGEKIDDEVKSEMTRIDNELDNYISGKIGTKTGVTPLQDVAKASSDALSNATSLGNEIKDSVEKCKNDTKWYQKVAVIARTVGSWLIGIGTKIINTLGGKFKQGLALVKSLAGFFGIGKGKADATENNEKNTNNKSNEKPASAPAAPAQNSAPQETKVGESVNVFGIDFDSEDYTLESAYDDDCSEIVALLDQF